MNVGLVGNGFIAKAVAAAASRLGHTVVPVTALVVRGAYRPGDSVDAAVDGWLRDHQERRRGVGAQLADVDVVINAAGQAQPASADRRALYDANAVLPGVLAEIAADAGVGRLVHVSTAAVQGRRDPLDETTRVQPFSPYSDSKAAGEAVLQRPGRCPEVILYRPTSVQGMGRPTTQRLLKLAPAGRFLMPGGPDVHLPVCLVENVAQGILHAAEMAAPNSSPVVLQPWEGMTTRLLLEAIGLRPTFVPVPAQAVKAAAGLALLSKAPRLVAPARRMEMLVLGQGQDAFALETAGFRPAVGPEGYRRLHPAKPESAA